MSNEPATEGDLRNTGMSLKHDREWDYELDRIIEAVEERDASRVGLQFPEGLKRRGPAVARYPSPSLLVGSTCICR